MKVKNVVLVHGAFADGSGWKGVYEILAKRGYNVTIVQNPMSSLDDDVAATDLTLFQSAPVLPENAILPPDNAGVVYIDKAKYRSSFCADVPKEQADLMAASQGQFAGKAFATPITDPAWRHLPSYACIATEDKMINPVIQRRIYERSKSIVTEIKGSHCIFMSQPQAVTAWIIKAATELSAKN